MQADLFEPSTSNSPGKLVLSLSVPGRMPSWNGILGMEQWARYKFKQELAAVFLSALQATERDSSMKIISARSTTLTFSDTLASYLRMRRELRESKSAKKRLARRSPSTPCSKYSNSKVPF